MEALSEHERNGRSIESGSVSLLHNLGVGTPFGISSDVAITAWWHPACKRRLSTSVAGQVLTLRTGTLSSFALEPPTAGQTDHHDDLLALASLDHTCGDHCPAFLPHSPPRLGPHQLAVFAISDPIVELYLQYSYASSFGPA